MLVASFALRGLFRGTVGQLFGLLGLIAGLYTAAWMGQWVGHHWNGARPAAVFWLLRWLVAILGGLAVASLFEWMSHLAREAIHETPAKWLDRAAAAVAARAESPGASRRLAAWRPIPDRDARARECVLLREAIRRNAEPGPWCEVGRGIPGERFDRERAALLDGPGLVEILGW